MKNNLWNMLKKETREMFRDKKSLAMMLVIPIFIPLLIIGMSALFETQMNKEIEEYNKIGITYEMTEEEKIKEISLIGDSTKAEGMGLGLSIIRTLVQAHSGEIRFSKSEQGGLKVTILLPLMTSKNNQQEEQNAQNNN